MLQAEGVDLERHAHLIDKEDRRKQCYQLHNRKCGIQYFETHISRDISTPAASILIIFL